MAAISWYAGVDIKKQVIISLVIFSWENPAPATVTLSISCTDRLVVIH
jgi:hypothetical protein